MILLPKLSHHRLRISVLAWFALTLLAAIASPLVQAQQFEIVCTGAGMVRMAAPVGHGDTVPPSPAAFDCPLCVPSSALPSSLHTLSTPPWPHATPVALAWFEHLRATAVVLPPTRAPPPLFSSTVV